MEAESKRASPKSPILILPSPSRKILAGFRSLWIIPLECMYARASKICLKSKWTSVGLYHKWPSSITARKVVLQYSIWMYKCLSLTLAPCASRRALWLFLLLPPRAEYVVLISPSCSWDAVFVLLLLSSLTPLRSTVSAKSSWKVEREPSVSASSIMSRVTPVLRGLSSIELFNVSVEVW